MTERATDGRADRRGADVADWHTITAETAVVRLATDAAQGLSSEEAARRLAEVGPNELEEERGRPFWRRILSLLTEPMTVVLIVAALVSAFVSGELKTPIAILVVVVFNAVLNLVQEQRAESALDALREMTVSHARVRRDGRVQQVDAVGLVPGDVVLLEAGDVVPADGRILQETGLEAQEAALTGESIPVAKDPAPVEDAAAALGDRTDMVFMSTEVTRGTGTFAVTGTGMATEFGRVAGLLEHAGGEQTPLQRRTGQLARLLSVTAGVVVVVVVVLGLLRGLPFNDVLLIGVSLAVATIPEGLTAVVAFTLAMGARRLAGRGAILKNLASVETLGSTSHIATDKTGTLTLNQMTARRLLASGCWFEVTGQGYADGGQVLADGDEGGDPAAALLAMALASDAVVRDGQVVGDPTEAALVVLAHKGGVDVDAARRAWPRWAEVPFDSSRKYMATLHRPADAGPTARRTATAAGLDVPDHGVLLFAKGAADVLARRSSLLATPTGPVPLDEDERQRLTTRHDDLAAQGLRVLAIAYRRYDDLDEGSVPQMEPEELDEHVDGLTLLALVGIVDPPRPEARSAVAEAQQAGIVVHMITGDHVGTASAIADDLGIHGEAILGTEVEGLDDQELARRAVGLGVLARVSPEHKIRMVNALRSDGSVVAMTGDGVNDAPALKQADIGIAMGITGTEVSKGAARMILTDDNFATIVTAVREGRGIYDNIVKFVRFQITTSWGFVVIFLTSSLFGLAGGAPFTPLQILWVNIIMDGPPAMALGLDEPDPDVMRRPPRPVAEPILTRHRLYRILLSATVMAVGIIALLVALPDGASGDASGTSTVVFTTYVLFQLFNLLNVRSDERSVFARSTFTNRWLWIALGAVLVLQVAAVHVPWLQGLFDTTALSLPQWALAVAVASSVLWVEEARKAFLRHRSHGRTGESQEVAPSARPAPVPEHLG
ncbi:cation-translocating P-type ATPase [Aquipuribacter sp. MA13-6]|uniref:cation-translocating P-type ATPase n=1 Tax=unclassified Aquipuribacter TaxID=2635084 RepID=UPI003EEA900F